MKQLSYWRLGAAAVTAVVCLWVVVAAPVPGEGTEAGPRPPALPARGKTPATPSAGPILQPDGLDALPASLRGLDIAGEFEEDERGNLKITRGVRDVFDHFLSASGEETLAQTRQRIHDYAHHRVRSRAAAQALALFDTYVAYKDQLDAKLGSSRASTIEQVKTRMHTVRDIRRRSFEPAVVQAFFGDDEAYDQYALDRAAILADTKLSPQQAAAKVAELLARQSPEFRQQRDALEMVQTLDTLTTAWQARSGSPGELRQLRETLVGKDATARLETLDRDTETWNSRVSAYLQRRDSLRTDPTLANEQRLHAIADHRQKTFSAEEFVRIEALERIHDSGATNASQPPATPGPH